MKPDEKQCQLEKRDSGILIVYGEMATKSGNVMAESFIKTFKAGHVYMHDSPDAKTIIKLLPLWFEDYNINHPQKGLRRVLFDKGKSFLL